MILVKFFKTKHLEIEMRSVMKIVYCFIILIYFTVRISSEKNFKPYTLYIKRVVLILSSYYRVNCLNIISL